MLMLKNKESAGSYIEFCQILISWIFKISTNKCLNLFFSFKISMLLVFLLFAKKVTK